MHFVPTTRFWCWGRYVENCSSLSLFSFLMSSLSFFYVFLPVSGFHKKTKGCFSALLLSNVWANWPEFERKRRKKCRELLFLLFLKYVHKIAGLLISIFRITESFFFLVFSPRFNLCFFFILNSVILVTRKRFFFFNSFPCPTFCFFVLGLSAI